MLIINLIGTFLIWTFKGFKGKLDDIYMDKPFLTTEIGLICLVILLFFYFHIFNI